MMFSRPTLFLALSLPSFTHALPGGAQSCPFGQAAPQGFHGSGVESSTSLDEGGFTVTLDGDLVVGETRMLTLTGDRVFRGFLVRLEGDGALEPIGTMSQVAAVCGDVPGVTHTSRDDKTMIQTFVTPLSAGEMLLDVSVVEFNNANDGNVYSYAQIAVTASDVVAPVTEAPAVAPPVTEAPVVAVPGTEAPVVVPGTEAPVVAPTDAPAEEEPMMGGPGGGPGGPGGPDMTEETLPPVLATPNATAAPVVNVTDPPTDAPMAAPMVDPMDTNMTSNTTEPRVVDYNESGAAAVTPLVMVGLVSLVALFM